MPTDLATLDALYERRIESLLAVDRSVRALVDTLRAAGVLDQTYLALTELVLNRVKNLEHPLDRLRAVVDTTISFHRERPQLIGGLFQLWAMGGRDFQTVLERERRAVVAARDALVETVRRVHAGETYLPPQLAAKLAERVSGEALSPREIDVLQRMAVGKSNKEIGTELFISGGTVKPHIKSIFN